MFPVVSRLVGRFPGYRSAAVWRTLHNKDSAAKGSKDVPDAESKFTRLRRTADHTLPGLSQLRVACQKLITAGVREPEAAVEQLKEEVGPCVAIGRFVMNLSHPDLLTTIKQLQSTGFTVTQILDDPRLLNKSAQEELMTSPSTRKYDQAWLDILAEKLGTSAEELFHRAPAKMNAFYPRSRQEYLDKIDILLTSGAREDDILECLSLLNRSLSCIRTRCQEVVSLGLADSGLPLKLLNQGQHNYTAMIKYRKKMMELLGPHSDAWHCLAQKLDTTPELIKRRLRPFDLVGTMEKIDLLLEMGITRDDIILRPRLVNFSKANILRAKLVIDDHDMDISASSLSYFLEKNSFPSKQNKMSMMEALCVLLNCSMSDLRDHFKYLNPALTSTISSIENSIRLLVSQDITLAEIATCPMVLNHSAELIQRAFSDGQLRPLDQWKNRGQLVNALVYTLDRYEPVESVEEDIHEESIHGDRIYGDRIHEDGTLLGPVDDHTDMDDLTDFVLDKEEEAVFAERWSVPSRCASFGFTM